MAKENKELVYTQNYIEKLYKTYTDQQLAKKFYSKKADYDRNSYKSFESKYVDVLTRQDEYGVDEYPKIMALHKTDRTYLVKVLYANHTSFVQDTTYNMKMEGVLALVDKLLEENWELYCEQRTKRAVKSFEEDDEKMRDLILLEPSEVIKKILISFKELTDTINLTNIKTL